MNNEHIRHLLLRFYDGQTTSDEEEELKRFFDNNNIPEELYADKILFLNMKHLNEKETKRIARMSQHMEQEIDCWEEEEKTKAHRSRPFGKIKRYIIYAAGIAAALAITYNRIYLPEKEPEYKDTFTNPEDAYMETEKALQLFTSALNKGTKPLKNIEEAANKIQNTLDKLQK